MQAEEATLTPRAAETRRRILEAAGSVFAERGFDAATTREIAALCELNAATPYTYFPSKEALYQAVIENAVAPLIELMDEFASESDKPGAAAGAIHRVLTHLASHGSAARLMVREIVEDGPLAERLQKSLFEPLVERVRAEMRAAGHVEPDMEPFVAALYIHLSFGHVALAPLLSRVFDVDLLSPESLARQVRVIGSAAAGSLSAAPGEAPSPTAGAAR